MLSTITLLWLTPPQASELCIISIRLVIAVLSASGIFMGELARISAMLALNSTSWLWARAGASAQVRFKAGGGEDLTGPADATRRFLPVTFSS